jgi:AcrR family transcriptional regulator
MRLFRHWIIPALLSFVRHQTVTERAIQAQVHARPRGRPRKAAAGAAIVEATLELLADRGFQATTMDAIAARAGVGKNTIYRRWSSKEELVADAVRELTAEADPPKHEGDVYSLLQEEIHALVRLFADPLVGQVLPSLLGELHRNPDLAAAWAERVVGPRREAITTLLSRALERGELREGTDPQLIADLLAGPPFLRLLLPFGVPKAPKRYADELLETIWRGIAPA